MIRKQLVRDVILDSDNAVTHETSVTTRKFMGITIYHNNFTYTCDTSKVDSKESKVGFNTKK